MQGLKLGAKILKNTKKCKFEGKLFCKTQKKRTFVAVK